MYLINHNNIKLKTEKCAHLMLLLIYGKFFKIFYLHFLNCKISNQKSDTHVSGSGSNSKVGPGIGLGPDFSGSGIGLGPSPVPVKHCNLMIAKVD